MKMCCSQRMSTLVKSSNYIKKKKKPTSPENPDMMSTRGLHRHRTDLLTTGQSPHLQRAASPLFLSMHLFMVFFFFSFFKK